MAEIHNPFIYESANRLPLEDLIEVYIPAYNYSRFLKSKRNLIILGDRGSGKTSTLLNNSVQAELLWAKKEDRAPDLTILGIYVPGNSPYVAKRDFELLLPRQARVFAEHYLSSTIALHVLAALEQLPEMPEVPALIAELEYVAGWKLPEGVPFLRGLSMYLAQQAHLAQTQTLADGTTFPRSPMGFSSTVMLLVRILRHVPGLERSHVSFMIDDVHNLNEYHRAIINSWISYRQVEEVSIKIAAAKSAEISYITDEGGSILEGHDYTLIDLEKPFQASDSTYYSLAKEIVEKRLANSGLENVSAEDFFPASLSVQERIAECQSLVRDRYIAKNPEASDKQVRDHVYKYARAEFFRSRAAKANLPSYSGFDVITHVSTGVIRNLLQPCYWMFEEANSSHGNGAIASVEPAIQDTVIKRQSEEMWRRLERDLAFTLPGCTLDQAKHLYNLFNHLAILFEDRLQNHASEPRAIVFTISGADEGLPEELETLLRLAREFQILYTRRGSSKDDGERETYYVPNRMLWPIRGLDPVGQHSRVSLTAASLLAAAHGTPFPKVSPGKGSSEPSLFEGEV